MLHVVLVEPEIPANTGNIARTCAATGSALHLIRPLGFDISEKAVRRAGLDYWHLVDVRVYDNLEDFFKRIRLRKCGACPPKRRGLTPKPSSTTAATFFGKETRGLPEDFLACHRSACLRIPMRSGARSLNLSNSVAITVYEALRQLDFPQLQESGQMTDW